MKKLILITLFFSSFSLSQITSFEATFTFTELSIHSQDLALGFHPDGSDGLDLNLGETIVPQVPQGTFGVRFQLPSDTSLYTLKDIRFGCGQIYSYEHMIDLSYEFGNMDVNWEWSGAIERIKFKNPYNGEVLETFEAFWDSSFYLLPALDKIIIEIIYSVPLSWPSYSLTAPWGGEVIEGGQNYLISWSASLAQWTDIEFSSNNGSSWEYVAQNIPASQNSYSWNVPSINSESCLLRIGYYPCAYDQSDSVFTITFPVKVENENELPTEFSLSQNYPNPFNPVTSIKYTVSSMENVTLKVYDVLGNEVATLVNEEKPAGEYEVEFTVGQDSSPDIASGIYYYQLKAGSYIETKKMVLLK